MWNNKGAGAYADFLGPISVESKSLKATLATSGLPKLRHNWKMSATTTLWRPVGQPELDLIEASGWSAFPPRLDWQPIFYPVLNEAYATRIASEWNTKDAENGNVGYVLHFEVETEFLAKYPVQIVGDAQCQELWVPAEELDEFNKHIIGPIEVASEWRDS